MNPEPVGTIKTLIPLALILATCSVPHEHTLKPGRKFIDAEVRHGRLVIQTRPAAGIPPEIILFPDGTGREFTIRETP